MHSSKQRKLRTLAILSGLFVLSVPSCQSTEKEPLNVSVYVGDPAKAGVSRGQADEFISSKDKKFGEMFCLFERDMRKLLERALTEEENKSTFPYFRGK